MKSLLLLLMLCGSASAEWHVEGAIGAVHNFSSTLRFGEQTIDANYETRPFESPLYYALRGGSWHWDVELIHQKIFLKNPDGDLERFAISHGYNFLLLNYRWHIAELMIRFGAGAVIAHPEVRLRGSVLEPGYNMTGPGFQISVQKTFFLSNRFFVNAEAKFTAARAQFTIDQSDVSAPNVALHALFGFGINL
jgi:hypothetical protein